MEAIAQFDKIGALFEDADGPGYRIEECLYRGLLLHNRYALDDIPRKSFSNVPTCHDALLTAFSGHVQSLPMSHHCLVAPVSSLGEYDSRDQYTTAVDLWNDFVAVGCKADSATNRVDYEIVGDALRRTGIPTSHVDDIPATTPTSYPLFHDLSVNNIYVDDEYNITCIIDWAFASTVLEAMLLSPPGLPQFGDRISSELYASFIDGLMAAIPQSGAVSDEEIDKYRDTLGRGQLTWSLTRLLNLDSTDDYALFSSIWDSTQTQTAAEDCQRYMI